MPFFITPYSDQLLASYLLTLVTEQKMAQRPKALFRRKDKMAELRITETVVVEWYLDKFKSNCQLLFSVVLV